MLCRHVNNGAVLARSSQPEVGWLGWRSPEDEDLLKALANACSYDKELTMMDSIPHSDIGDDGTTTNNTKVGIEYWATLLIDSKRDSLKEFKIDSIFVRDLATKIINEFEAFNIFLNCNALFIESSDRGRQIVHNRRSK